MAWTNPKTWSVGETLTAANFNTHIRDNLNATGPHLVVRKASDESLSSNTTLQDDDALTLAVLANEVWECRLHLLITSAATPDFKFAFTFPTGGTFYGNLVTPDTAGTLAHHRLGTTTSPTSSIAVFIADGSPQDLEIVCTLVNGGTAGNLTLQWAQATSSASATIVKANSTLWAVKLA